LFFGFVLVGEFGFALIHDDFVACVRLLSAFVACVCCVRLFVRSFVRACVFMLVLMC
jgi:hypothetical protein